MENLVQEVENLKRKIRFVEEERDELKVALHIVTIHCCHIIGEKEDKKVEDVYKETGKNVHELMHGCKC